MFRILPLLLFISSCFNLHAQTCSIISAGNVCKEELMSFDVSASAGINSLVWDMGDASTSTQQSFSHKYSSKGVKNVQVILNLAGGGTCTASKKITVYELPVIKISQKTDNNPCLWKNNICLVDSSTAGDSALKIKKRIILWDDGSQDVDNYPPLGDFICHHYNNVGKFKVTIEITNDQDCKIEKQIDVEIIKDLIPNILVFSPLNDGLKYCDSAKTEFWDVTTGKDTSTVLKRIYSWGDGSPDDTTKGTRVFHFYKKSGSYNVSLTFIQKNGCVTIKDTLIEVEVFSVNFNLTKNSARQCLGSIFRFTHHDKYSGALYTWYLQDTIQNIMLPDQIDAKTFDFSPFLGLKRISLTINNHGCIRTFKYDTIKVIGVSAQYYVLNQNQCDNRDSVYFRLATQSYETGKLFYFWDFDDDKAPQCTTSRTKGVNVNSNCNFSTDSVGVHYYINPLFRTFRVQVKDTVSGCPTQAFNDIVNVLKPDSVKFNVFADRYCYGNKSQYYVSFSHNLSPIIKIVVNVDSSCDRHRFSSRYVGSTPYPITCDELGRVTVGFAIKYGDSIVYTGLNDKKDYYIDKRRICYDTIWKHHWFTIADDPKVNFDPKFNCIHQVTKPLIIDSVQKKLSFAIWNWGDKTAPDTVWISPTDSVIPRPSHTYHKAGIYLMQYYLENQNRCFASNSAKVQVGFIKQLRFDPVICPGSKVLLKDSMSYYDSNFVTNQVYISKNYWHIPSRKLAGKEEFKWDFDDGRGFVVDTARPIISFPNSGFYTVKLAAKDSVNCWDTLTQLVNVGGVHAGIKNLYRRIICDGIVQLRDSSYSDFKPPVDSITSYYWDFGDGGNPSYLQNPFHYYSTFGNYTIFQKVSNSRGCTDTAYIHITIEGPVAKFDIVGDTVACAPFTAHFDNTSVKVRDYIWYFGDPLKTKLSTNKDTNVSFTYTKPGVYYIYLFGSDSVVNPNAGNAIYYCKSFFPDTNTLGHPVRRITVLPAPKANFSVGPIQCNNAPIVVTDQSDSLYTLYRWKIKNVDSVETSSKSAELRTADTGNFVIQYTPWFNSSARACYDTVRKTIRVSGIQAEFDLFKDSSSCPEYTFVNTSQNYQSAIWNLNDPKLDPSKNMRTDEHFTFRYSEKGNFSPCLMVVNNNGCKDTLCKEVMVNVTKKLVIPNVFTPGNFDKLNDAFDIQAEGLAEYHLSIYNRWGQLLFHSNIDGSGDDGNNWRGRPNITSPIYPDGTYYYTFTYKFKCESKTQEAHGTITLIGTRD